MSFRLPFGRGAFFVAAFAFALVALFPLGLAIRWLGLDEARTRGAGGGRQRLARRAQGGATGPRPDRRRQRAAEQPALAARPGAGQLGPGGRGQSVRGRGDDGAHGFGFDDVTGQLRLGSLFAPLPITALELEDVSAGFASGLCSRAEGRVRATVTGQIGGMNLTSGLAGAPACAGDAVLLPLVSQSGMEQLNVRFFADGRYRVELAVRTADAAVGQQPDRGRIHARKWRIPADR